MSHTDTMYDRDRTKAEVYAEEYIASRIFDETTTIIVHKVASDAYYRGINNERARVLMLVEKEFPIMQNHIVKAIGEGVS